jgi:hypothetical protein
VKPIVFVGVLLIPLLGTPLFAQEKPKTPAKKPDFATLGMKFKLELSQRILTALALEDFKSIAENATAMKGLNQIEDFVRTRNKEYTTQLHVFEFATNELVRLAEAKNIDGCSLAFTQMTISCVNCHKQLRKK